MASLIVAVRSLVLDGIATTPEFTTPDPETNQTPEVLLGWKTGWKRREKVFTTSAKFDHEPASMRSGKTFRNEAGSFDLVILIEGVAQSCADVSTRALVLGQAVEDWIATHSNWDGHLDGLNWIQINGGGELAEMYLDKGVLVELTYPVVYRARLT